MPLHKSSYRSFFLLIFSLFLFCTLLTYGFLSAQHKPLWVDELFTQSHVVEKLTTADILIGRNKSEPNRCPLFNLIQKSVVQTARYTLPHPWKGEATVFEPKGQIILRIVPVVFMSLSLVLIFYYFARFHSLGFGLYAFFLSVSSHMVWQYIAEARSYSLWVFLSTSQIILLLTLGDKKLLRKTFLGLFALTNILLSLTFIVAIGQVIMAVILYWFFYERRQQSVPFRQRLFSYLWILIVPLMISIYYYFQSNQFGAQLVNNISYLLLTCIPIEQVIIIGSFIIIWLLFLLINRQKLTLKYENSFVGYAQIVFLSVLYFGLTAALILFIQLKSVENGVNAPITVRHFIYLTPIGIIATTMVFKACLTIFKKNRWMQFNIIVLFMTMAIVCFLKYAFPILRMF